MLITNINYGRYMYSAHNGYLKLAISVKELALLLIKQKKSSTVNIKTDTSEFYGFVWITVTKWHISKSEVEITSLISVQFIFDTNFSQYWNKRKFYKRDRRKKWG